MMTSLEQFYGPLTSIHTPQRPTYGPPLIAGGQSLIGVNSQTLRLIPLLLGAASDALEPATANISQISPGGAETAAAKTGDTTGDAVLNRTGWTSAYSR